MSNSSRPFLIYSLARCGSTNLQRILNACAGRPVIADEPFHPIHVAQFMPVPPTQPAELPPALAYLRLTFQGLKHVWHPGGWPFQDVRLNQALLEQAGDVVLLVRRNILQRVVSSQISEQLQLWHPLNPAERERFYHFDYQELNQEEISWFLSHEPALLAGIRHQLQREGRRWMEVAYEDLYGEDPARRWQTFQQLLDFTGIPCAGGQAQWEQLLSRHRKINSKQTYARIPGIETINLLYGSAETGFLF